MGFVAPLVPYHKKKKINLANGQPLIGLLDIVPSCHSVGPGSNPTNANEELEGCLRGYRNVFLDLVQRISH